MATASNKLPALPIPDRTNLVTLPAVAKPPRTNIKWLKWALLAGIAAALAVVGLEWRAHVQTAIHYETVPVERGSIQANVTATGTLNAVVDVLVSSQVSGNIKALYADWNTKVKKGQLVALIDPEIFQSQVDQAQATYRSAHSATVTAQAQSKSRLRTRVRPSPTRKMPKPSRLRTPQTQRTRKRNCLERKSCCKTKSWISRTTIAPRPPTPPPRLR